MASCICSPLKFSNKELGKLCICGMNLSNHSVLCRRPDNLPAAHDSPLQIQALHDIAALDTLDAKHTSEVDQLQTSDLQNAYMKDAQKQSENHQALLAQQADSKAALEAQAAAHASATAAASQQHQAQLAQLQQQVSQQQRDEQIRARQAHSQHSRILEDWKAHSQRALDAQAAAHASTVAGLTQHYQGEIAKLEKQVEQQAADHAEELEQIIADKDRVHDELCNDAAKLEATLLRDHKDAVQAKDNILAQNWQLLQQQTYNRNMQECYVCL